jgi:hypothetical protein
LVKEMFRPAELVERIRRLVHGRPPVIITALDSTWRSQPGAASEPRSSRLVKARAAETSVHGQGGNGPCVHAV